MKLATVLSLVAAVVALPTAKDDIAARASYSKVDGLKFNIDGVTKCKSKSSSLNSALTLVRLRWYQQLLDSVPHQ